MRRNGTGASGVARLGAVLALVLGILGMHAFSHHSTTHQAETSTLSVAAAAAAAAAVAGPALVHPDGTHSSHEPATTSAPAGAALDVDSEGGEAGEPWHSLGEMVMLCGVMLVAAATFLGLLAFAGAPRRAWVVRPRILPRLAPARWRSATGAGPPPVWQFSVVRC